MTWARRERREHMTDMLGDKWQLHANDIMGQWN